MTAPYTHNGSRVPTDSNAGANEIANINVATTNVFIEANWADRTASSDRFHQIVMWQTQDQFYSALGNLTCQIP